jgi:hypothetical protein
VGDDDRVVGVVAEMGRLGGRVAGGVSEPFASSSARCAGSASTPTARSRRMYSAAVAGGMLPLTIAGIAPRRANAISVSSWSGAVVA